MPSGYLPPRALPNVQNLVLCVTLKPLPLFWLQENREMPHLDKDELLRAAGAGRSEIARMAGDLSRCPRCRALAASLLRDQGRASAREVPLRVLLETAAFERAS